MNAIEKNLKLLKLMQDRGYDILDSYDEDGSVTYIVRTDLNSGDNYELEAWYDTDEEIWNYYIAGIYNSGEDRVEISMTEIKDLYDFTNILSDNFR